MEVREGLCERRFRAVDEDCPMESRVVELETGVIVEEEERGKGIGGRELNCWEIGVRLALIVFSY